MNSQGPRLIKKVGSDKKIKTAKMAVFMRIHRFFNVDFVSVQ